MIIVCVEVVTEEGAVDKVRDALASMETETRKEAGCISYAFSIDVTDPCTMRVSERWESMEALRVHAQPSPSPDPRKQELSQAMRDMRESVVARVTELPF